MLQNTSPLPEKRATHHQLGVSHSAGGILNLQAEQPDLSLLTLGFKTQMSYCRVTCYCTLAASQQLSEGMYTALSKSLRTPQSSFMVQGNTGKCCFWLCG